MNHKVYCFIAILFIIDQKYFSFLFSCNFLMLFPTTFVHYKFHYFFLMCYLETKIVSYNMEDFF